MRSMSYNAIVTISSMCVSLTPSSKKRSLITIQNRVKRSFLTRQMDAVDCADEALTLWAWMFLKLLKCKFYLYLIWGYWLLFL